MKYAILCNEKGIDLLGTEGHLPLDGRNGFSRNMETVREYRSRFLKNFAWKAEYWTHVMFSNSITGTGKLYKI